MGRLKIAFPFLLFVALGLLVVWSNRRAEPPSTEVAAEEGAETPRDPVCHMEVNPSWGFHAEADGQTILFCSARCRNLFVADPEAYSGERCVVCSGRLEPASAFPATYLGRTYLLCSAEHRAAFKEDPAGFFMHRMWGIPDWLYYVSIALILVTSFLLFEGRSAFRRLRRGGPSGGDGPPSPGRPRPAPRRVPLFPTLMAFVRGRPDAGAVAEAPLPVAVGSPVAAATTPRTAAPPPPSPAAPPRVDRLDLMRVPVLGWLLRSRMVRFFCQLVVVALFALIVAAGLFGNQNPALNIAPLLTWTIWWCGLVVLILYAAKAWCYACPWDALAGWMERGRLWRKSEQGFGLGLKWPRALRNLWLATILFVGLTWFELGFGITMRPAATAWLAIALLLMAIVSAFLFDRKSFCRYGCLVGRVSGLYALFAGTEVRARDSGQCRSCSTKECVKGSTSAYGCPTFEYPGGMERNTYCIQCGECLQSCPHDNMTVNLRPWGADLEVSARPRSDEAYLALLMLAISGFHGLTMTPVWGELTGALESTLSVGRIVSFSSGMAALLAIPILLYAALVWVSYRITAGAVSAGERQATYRDYFIRYAYCVLPIALFYHLAHNLEHMLMEGPKVFALLSDPFGHGWNLLGTAGWRIPPMVSLDVLWILQVILVAVGHVYSLWAARRISRGLFTSEIAAARGQWPMLIGMIAFSVFSLWLLKQPMEMRTSAM